MSEPSITAAFDTARDWRAKGELGWELRALSSGLNLALAAAVADHPDPASGVAFLVGQGVAGTSR